MASASSSPDTTLPKENSISFAPPPPELNLSRTSQDSQIDDNGRTHPELTLRRTSSTDVPGSFRKSRAMSSPPPPPTYTPRVSFDTFDTQDATTFALTLRSKHRMYRYQATSRTFLLGLDHKDYSQYALEWGMKELFEDNDEVVILRVIDSGTYDARPGLTAAEKAQLESEGQDGEKAYQVEAKRLLDSVIEQNKDEKALNVIVELVVGRFQDQVQRMIEIYSPDSLIVGTRGRDGAIGGLLPGSMSKYCLQHSPVPVIVVHPSQRRLHRKNKRQNDPDRQSYLHLLKLAKQQNPSEEVFPTPVPTPKPSTPVPDINVETPESVSPSEPELVTVASMPAVSFHDPDLAEKLHHTKSDPGHPSSPSPPSATGGVAVAAAVAALEKERENLSPGSKG